MADDFDTRVESLIAEVLNDFSSIGRDNIEGILRSFAMRGFSIDRHATGGVLYFYDQKTGMQRECWRGSLNELVPRIPKIRDFEKTCNEYLKHVRINVCGVSRTVKGEDDRFDGLSVEQFLREQVLPRALNTDNPLYVIEQSDTTDKQIKVIVGNYNYPSDVCDRGALVVLLGPSKRTLPHVSKALKDIGFENVELKCLPVRPTKFQSARYACNLVFMDTLKLGNVSKLIWAVIGSVVTALALAALKQIIS